MTDEKNKNRKATDDFSEIGYDFLLDDDTVYSPFDKDYEVPFIIPTEAEPDEIVPVFYEDEKSEWSLKNITPLFLFNETLDFAEYLGDEIITFTLKLVKTLYPFISIPLMLFFSFIRYS